MCVWCVVKSRGTRRVRPVSVGVSLEFHLHLIACHICIFMTCQRFNEEREELGFMGMKLSWHSYQLSMSHRIKCLWNYGMKLSIESGCFIRVLFYSIWYGSLGNNKMKLSTETGLKQQRPCSVPDSEAPELVQYALNAYCSNLFVFGKNYSNFD
jgi:hypothetical protein